MKLNTFFRKNRKMKRDDKSLSRQDRMDSRPIFDSFPALLPTTQNFFALK